MIDFLGRYGVRLRKGLFNFITTNPIRADTVSPSRVSGALLVQMCLGMEEDMQIPLRPEANSITGLLTIE